MHRILLVVFFLISSPCLAADRLLVFAAASQRDAMLEIGTAYETQCDCKVVFSFAATSTLARQIAAGAKADVFVSANQSWADWLESRTSGVITRKIEFASNRLVIASAARTRDSFNILNRGRFVMADPISVPAGIFARQAMEAMNIWEQVQPNAVFTENVRVALARIRRGDLLSGIVYQSDLHRAPNLHAHYVFSEDLHDPIQHVGVAISAEGDGFLSFLGDVQALKILKNHGFLPPNEDS